MYLNIASANISMPGIGVVILKFMNGSFVIIPLPNPAPSTIILLMLYVQQLF